MPEISVVVPVYKAEGSIRRCIESILSQTFTDFELILVDDGSPDRSGAICDAYATQDRRVHVIHKPNGGVSSARNTGIDIAKGNWITFIDSDDYVAGSYLQDLYDPDYDMNVVGHIHYVENQAASEPRDLHEELVRCLDVQSFSDVLSRNGKYWLLFCWGRLFKRQILQRYHLRFEEGLHVGEDYVFSSQYLSLCKSLRLDPSTSYIHTDRQGSLSKTFDVTFFEHLLRSEQIIGQIFSDRFQRNDIRKSEKELIHLFADSLCAVNADPSQTLMKKRETIHYLLCSSYFRKGLADMDQYFAGTSKLFRWIIQTRCTWLILFTLTIAQKRH
ncbi:MAG: glycosyltransferase family 2 protein [Oscillospiraceae bacterium]|nr:glycosyltransferase family 2 protein [Bacteroidales bacterium]MBQ9761490.1 glycosyltransferase family 2 protein [Oscillospiraceae bacterium]